MADSAARAQRATALEEKRRRLDDLKKRREVRGQDAARVHASATANLDEYIDGLLKEPDSRGVEPKEQPNNNNKSVSAAESEVSDDSAANLSSNDAASGESAPVAPTPAPAPIPASKLVESFTVATQTDDIEGPTVEEVEDEDDERAEQNEVVDKLVLSALALRDDDKDSKLLTLTEIEKEVVSQPFSAFINTTSKKVERMLGSPLLSDLLVDFVGENDNKLDRILDTSNDSNEKFLQSRQVFECRNWTTGRDVTDMDWSPLHRELILSTYHMSVSSNSVAPTKGHTAISAVAPTNTLSSSLTPRSGELQSDGLALIWSLNMTTRPEHIVTCGSPVTTGRFHPTNATLVIGGCESGQLVVWDLRSGRLPVQKSALTTIVGASNKGHTHPIGAMEVIEGGSGLVTTSTDGRVNFWSLTNLRDPAESMNVGESVSCFAVAPESESLLMGDENGSLYAISSASQSTSGQRSSRRNVKKLETADAEGENYGHYGMVTSLSAKALRSSATTRAAGLSKGFLRGMGGLVLSSGVDWTVKLWAPAYSDRPLISLVSHSYDYMSDVAWSPTHPSLFATGSSNGTVGLWNLATSFEEPLTGTDGIVVEPDAMSGRGVNKLKWSADGRRVAVASSDRVHLLSLSDEVVNTKGDEESKVMHQLLARGLIDRQ